MDLDAQAGDFAAEVGGVRLGQRGEELEPLPRAFLAQGGAVDLGGGVIDQRTRGLPCVVLRTSRFFPEDDDTHALPAGENLKANELLYRRLTVEDAAAAHWLALQRAPAIGFDVLVVSAPPPFTRADAAALGSDAAGVVERLFPDAAALYAARGWTLYDPARAERVLGFRAATDYAAVLAALRSGAPLPFAHDPGYVSPALRAPLGP